MKIPLIAHLLLLFSELISFSLGGWASLYSPEAEYAYIKLSTNEIIPIYTVSDEGFSIQKDQNINSVIDPPTEGNYSLALANGDLFAVYASTKMLLRIDQLDPKAKKWIPIAFNTTLPTTLEFFNESSVMTSLDSQGTSEKVYIYGGITNNTISDRLLQFDPKTQGLNQIVSSISPTSFYGAGNAVMDRKGVSNIVIGGRAKSGWVSMFQVAIWEYQTWSFKTVAKAAFNVNSRVNPLILPVFSRDEVNSFVVLGGELAGELSNPYVMSLNITANWKWTDLTGVGDFDIEDTLGAVIINNTLISVGVNVDNMSKRASQYQFKLFDAGNLQSTEKLLIQSDATRSVDPQASDSLLPTTASLKLSSLSSETVSSPDESPKLVSEAISSSTPTVAADSANTSQKNTAKIAIGVTVPVVSLILILLSYFLVKKLSRSGIFLDSLSTSDVSDSSSNITEYYNEISDFDNHSMSSWNRKRDEYEREQVSKSEKDHGTSVQRPRKSMDRLTLEELTSGKQPLVKLKSIYKSPLDHSTVDVKQKRSHNAFANPEEYPDRQELTMSYHSDRSKLSVFSGDSESESDIKEPPKAKIRNSNYNVFDQEEDQIDEFLSKRDVQVLVSSERRSVLRITNPDISDSDEEANANSIHQRSSSDSHSAVSDGFSHQSTPSIIDLDIVGGDKKYFDDVLRVFDEELEN